MKSKHLHDYYPQFNAHVFFLLSLHPYFFTINITQTPGPYRWWVESPTPPKLKQLHNCQSDWWAREGKWFTGERGQKPAKNVASMSWLRSNPEEEGGVRGSPERVTADWRPVCSGFNDVRFLSSHTQYPPSTFIVLAWCMSVGVLTCQVTERETFIQYTLYSFLFLSFSLFFFLSLSLSPSLPPCLAHVLNHTPPSLLLY